MIKDIMLSYNQKIVTRNILLLVVTGILFTACSKKNDSAEPTEINDTYKIHSIYELNKEEEGLDSHAGEEEYSVLEMDYQSYTLVPLTTLNVSAPHYARVKKTAAGTYLLFYQDALTGANSYISRSTDLLNWPKGELLFAQQPITVAGAADSRRYSTCDAVMLANGDILAVASFRANQGYRYYPEQNGIAIRRSTDNGVTWGKEQVIYSGTNWEPYLLELPDGELQCYFTDTDPSYNSAGISYANSGTSMVLSKDGGATWEPTGTSNCYKVFRQYKYLNEGKRIYTDQMPVVRMLNDGHSLVGFLEARLESGPGDENSTYWMSLVYGQDKWVNLTGDQVGPADRASNLFKGAAGYITQFPSGETLISCNIDQNFSMKLGDNKARRFNQTSWATDWYQPFSKKGVKGSLEISHSHEAIGTIRSDDGIMIARFILNHRIDAPRAAITVDGRHEDWVHTQALFLGSESEVQTVFRAASDAANIYILAERRDSYLSTGDNIDVYLHTGSTGALGENSLRVQVGPNGLIACYRYKGGAWQITGVQGVKVANTVVGAADDGGLDKGYVSEIAVPLSAIDAAGGNILFNAASSDRSGTGSSTDVFTFTSEAKPATWRMIRLKN